MPQIDVQEIFLESASEVLETMFFTGIVDEDTVEDAASLTCAELTFHGSPSGRFGVRVPAKTARSIAASFLGLEVTEVNERQVADVLCELTNMFCGSVLSRVEAGARFELMHPEIDPTNSDWRRFPNVFGCTLGIEEGTVTLWMTMDEQQPAMVA